MYYCMKKSKQEEKTGTNVLIYCRVSSDEQAKGGSLDFQEERLKRYCSDNGYTIIDFDFREDESAKTFEWINCFSFGGIDSQETLLVV